MKIIIYQNREVYKENSKIGNDSENKVETLEFEFPEEYKDFTKYIEFQIKGEKYVDLIENNKYVITKEVAKYGKIKAQVVLKKTIENDVMIFKSDMFILTVSNSINATESLVNEVSIDFIEKLVSKNNEQDSRLNTVETNNTINSESISNLKIDNETNKTDILNLKQDQIMLNTNISNLEKDNISNKAKIESLELKDTEQDTNIQKNTESIDSINKKDTEQDKEIEEIKTKDTNQDNLIEELQEENKELKLENSLIKEQIPNGNIVGNSIHIEDSSNLEMSLKIKGGHRQETREGYNLIDFNVEQDVSTVTYNNDGSITINGNGGFFLRYKTLNLEKEKTYSQKIEIISGEISNSYMLNQKLFAMSFEAKTWLNPEETIYYTPEENAEMKSFWIHANAVFDNAVIKIWAYEGTEDKPYEQYGAMPSPDYPSEIETVNGNAEINIVNKNFLNIEDIVETEKGGIKYSVKNGILKLNGTSTSGFDIELAKNIKIKKGIYTHSCDYIQTGLYISLDNLSSTMLSITVGKTKSFEITSDKTYSKYFVWIDKGTVLNNVEIKFQLEVGNNVTDFDMNKSQSLVIPIQQEMLEGDYIDEIEHHEWGKVVFDGTENWKANELSTGAPQYYLEWINLPKNTDATCSHFIQANTAKEGRTFYINSNYSLFVFPNPVFNNNSIPTIDDWKAWLSDQYNAGTPVTVYYKLAEPLDLELTSEQKTIMEQKLNTYKNITNIDIDSELASLDVTYKKDIETEHNKLQNQINEIQQLISTKEV